MPTPSDDKQGFYENLQQVDHKIKVNDAARWVSKFQEEAAATNKAVAATSQKSIYPYSETFKKEAILQLLNSPGTSALRIYLAQDDDGLVRMVLAGVNAEGHDKISQPKAAVNKTATVDVPSEGDEEEDDDDNSLLENGTRLP